MGDLKDRKRDLYIKRYEHQKLVALSQIHAREIRIMELEEEMDRCRQDIAAQHGVIADADGQIEQQRQEIEKEKKEAVAN